MRDPEDPRWHPEDPWIAVETLIGGAIFLCVVAFLLGWWLRGLAG